MKKKITLPILLCILLISKSYGVAIFEGDVTLTTQAEVDAFQFTEVTGVLTISGNDITDLSSLIYLTRVDQLVVRGNASLVHVAGLAALTQVGLTGNSAFKTAIDISDNPALTNLDGLSGLTTAQGAIIISNNPQLLSINGFSSLTRIGEGLRISNNPQLASINGFNGVTSISSVVFAALIIDNNTSLTNIDGLSSLSTISGRPAIASIVNNASLLNIDGLASLGRLEGFGSSITISDNAALKNINGLLSIRTITMGPTLQSLAINNNASLENLDGLSNLRSVFTGGAPYQTIILEITNNPSLTRCTGLAPLFISLGGDEVNYLVESGLFEVAQNGAGCTIADILAMIPQTVSGFTLVNTRVGEENYILDTEVEIDLANPDYSRTLLQAYTLPKTVGSVSFKVDNTLVATDNEFPYQLPLPGMTVGTHTITADVYTLPNRQGVKGQSKTLNVTVVNSAQIFSFDVVDIYGNFLMSLTEGAKINIKDPKFKSYSIRANASNGVSVKFWLNNQFFRVENTAPYALNGDTNGIYNPWNVNPWNYTIKAIPYVKVGGKEYAGKSLEVRFKVVSENPNLSIVVFELVTTTGTYIRTINEGETINVADPILNQMTVTAKTAGQVKSVKFELNNQFYRTENVAPYTMTGDQNGYFNPWFPNPGTYKLTAIPYTKTNATGEGGVSLTINFNVVNVVTPSASRIVTAGETDAIENKNADVTIYPVPVDDELYIKIDDKAGTDPLLTIVNGQGISLYNGTYSKSGSIKTSDFQPGLYYLKVVGNKGFQKVVKFIKK